MILFFESRSGNILAVGTKSALSKNDIEKLTWLFGEAPLLQKNSIEGKFIGPRREMITPWSTNAVEITQNMDISGIIRIEEFVPVKSANPEYDPMLQVLYNDPDQEVFSIDRIPEKVISINDLREYNDKEGLALNDDEIKYLEDFMPAMLGIYLRKPKNLAVCQRPVY